MASFPFSSVLITGANRGLGLGMVKHLLKSSTVPNYIIATCRSQKADNARELMNLAKEHSNVRVLEFDVLNAKSGPDLQEFVKQVSEIVQASGLNLLVNNAGVTIREGFDAVSADSLHSVFDVNVVAPCLITKAFRPLLKSAAKACDKAAVVNISSSLGSIESTNNAFLLAYRVSKASLNMLTKAISGEFAKDGIPVVSIHPGWVQTDMGGANATLTLDESISSLIKVIAGIQKSQTGSFFNYDGSILPW